MYNHAEYLFSTPIDPQEEVDPSGGCDEDEIDDNPYYSDYDNHCDREYHREMDGFYDDDPNPYEGG